jgi:hypothetical protein
MNEEKSLIDLHCELVLNTMAIDIELSMLDVKPDKRVKERLDLKIEVIKDLINKIEKLSEIKSETNPFSDDKA